MIIEKKGKYQNLLNDDYLKHLESITKIPVLFAALRGGHVWGYENALSDYDFYAFHNVPGLNDCVRYEDKYKNFDFVFFNLDYVISTSNKYYRNISFFPTIAYRTHDENESFKNIPYQFRNDFTSNLIFESLNSDYLLDNHYLVDNTQYLLDNVHFISLIDCYFSKAYGSKKNVLSKSFVIGIKYVEAFLYLAILKELIDYHRLVNTDLNSLLDKYCPKMHQMFIAKIIKEQRELAKSIIVKSDKIESGVLKCPKIQVNANQAFNEWYSNEVDIIKGQISSFSKKVNVMISIDENTALGAFLTKLKKT